jgi:hypothetical protein
LAFSVKECKKIEMVTTSFVVWCAGALRNLIGEQLKIPSLRVNVFFGKDLSALLKLLFGYKKGNGDCGYLRLLRATAATATTTIMTTAAAITYSSDAGIPPGVGAVVVVGATVGTIVGVVIGVVVGGGVSVTIGDGAFCTLIAVAADE